MTIDNELMDNCSKAKQINCDNLIKILHDNENTQYGREHGFDSIKSIEDYRNSVPLSDYSSFESYIERMRSGAENVLTVYPLAGFCRTSGSTGRSKYIPLSRTALQRYADSFEKHKAEYLCSIAKQRFFINAFRTDLSESPAKEALFTEYNFRYIYEQGIMDINEYIGGEKMLFSDGEYDILYAKVREALCTPDIRAFECIYMYELLNFFSYIEKRWEEIYHDIESRTFPSDIRLSPSVKEYLKGIEVSDERLREIKSECCKGFEGIAGRLWKKLCLVSGISSRTNITERIALQRYMGNIKRYGLCYCSSECSIGAAVDTDSYEYVMMPQNAFFEFLPYDCRNDQTLLPHELKAGKLYEPVITNFSGLYRYKTGDVVKITGYIGESPKMEFMFRKGQALNIAGEKYDIFQLEKAVFDLRKHDITVENYCFGVCLDTLPGQYIALLAAENSSISEQEASKALDITLCQNNSEYEDLRNLGELEKPIVFVCDGRKFSELMEQIGLWHRYGHNKPQHILKGEVSEAAWKSILEKIK